MNVRDFTDKLGKFDDNQEVLVENSFDFDVDFTQTLDIINKGGRVAIKINRNSIILDIGAFCMLVKKSELLDTILDGVSSILTNNSGMSKENIIDSLKTVSQIRMDNLEQCIPPSL